MSEADLMREAQTLTEMGKYRDAVNVLKTVVEEADELYDRMFAAGTIVSIIVYSIHGGNIPAQGTSDHDDCRKYAKISLECFDEADVMTQSGFHDLADGLRTTLSQLERTTTKAGAYQKEFQKLGGREMATETDVKVGMSLLDEVEGKINQKLVNLVAMPFGAEYNAEYDVFAKEMIKQCELAEKKLVSYQPGIARSNFLKGCLYGFYYQHGPMAYRAGHKKAVSAYEKAIELGFDETMARYHLAILYAAGLSKDNAIQNFGRVIQIQGPNSELGIECAKEIEKLKAKKGGCFIATAAYGSPLAPQVLVFYRFRDEILLTSKLGTASLISRIHFLKGVTRRLLLEPLLWLIKSTSRF